MRSTDPPGPVKWAISVRKATKTIAANPWATHSRFVVSHHLLRDEEYAATLRDWLDGDHGDALLVLDEAHNAAPASGAKYAIDSQFTKSVRELAPLFEHRLFLSATPHNGHSNSFSSLLEILDPQRFCRGVAIESVKQLEPVMVRRLKDDLRKLEGGFPVREVVEVSIADLPANDAELAGVLGHEIGHSHAHHIVRQQEKTQLLSYAALAARSSLPSTFRLPPSASPRF